MSPRPKAKAYVVHSLPGRTRFRIPERRHDQAFFSELAKHLAALKGVTKVESNPMTASVLLHHDGEIGDLLAQALGSPLPTMVEIASSAPPVARRIRVEIAEVDGTIRRFSNGEFDLSTLSAVGLLTLAGIQVLRGQQPITAVSLLWYASELLGRWRGSGESSVP